MAPGYETVKKMFEDNFVSGMDERSQLCVYVGQRFVVAASRVLFFTDPQYIGWLLTSGVIKWTPVPSVTGATQQTHSPTCSVAQR